MHIAPQRARTGLLITTFLSLLVIPAPSFASGKIVKSDFKGSWQISLRGKTACGFVSMLASMSIDTAGVGVGPIAVHGDCGDSTLTDQTFTITSLKATGKGTATLTCGTTCLWHFDIQMAPDRTTFNLADVNFTATDNYLQGLAIVRSTADNIVTADLKGTWFASINGHQAGDCSGGPFRIAVASTLTLDDLGAGNIDATLKTNCGTFDDPVNPITIVTLNPDGSGTAQLDCSESCAITFSIQVSPDRSMMSLVSVSPGDPDDMLAGVAIRRSTGGSITRPNLAGRWQGTLFVEELDGDVASGLIKFELNAKGKTISSSIVTHDTEGDNTSTGVSFTVTVNPDGSGTLKLSCGEGCTTTFQLQVSPDRSTMTIVDVSSGTEDLLIGVLIHQ